MASSLHEGEEYIFFGKVERDSYSGGRQMVSPRFQPKGVSEGYLHPIYRQTEKLNSAAIARCVRHALELSEGQLQETLPDYRLKKYRLLPLREALWGIHFPKSEEEMENARRRLAFEELLTLELGLLARRPDGKPGIVLSHSAKDFTANLPFTLTGAQKRAIGEISNDLASGGVMRNVGMKYQYSYEEQWQPKNILVTFRMYQLNLDGNESRVYKKYWDTSAVHFIEPNL